MVTLREEVGVLTFGFAKIHTRIILSLSLALLFFFLTWQTCQLPEGHSASPVRRYRRAADIGYAQLPGSGERKEGLMCH